MADTKKVCPECGRDLEGVDVEAHSLSHWPVVLDPATSSKEAKARKRLLEQGGVTEGEYLKRQKGE